MTKHVTYCNERGTRRSNSLWGWKLLLYKRASENRFLMYCTATVYNMYYSQSTTVYSSGGVEMCAKMGWVRERESNRSDVEGRKFWKFNYKSVVVHHLCRWAEHTYRGYSVQCMCVSNVSIHGEIRWSVKRLVRRELIRVQYKRWRW